MVGLRRETANPYRSAAPHTSRPTLPARQIQWDEDPLGEFDATEHPFHTQSINVNFIDIDQDLEQIGEDILDARLPYDRVLFTKDEWVVQTQNSMVSVVRINYRLVIGFGNKSLISDRD